MGVFFVRQGDETTEATKTKAFSFITGPMPTSLSIIDSHCHLDFPELCEDIPGVLERARAKGVVGALTISTRVRDFPRLLELADPHPKVWCSVGIHPCHVGEEPDITVETLVSLANHPKVVAFGETGLDYVREDPPRLVQRTMFERHCEAARRTHLPLIIHSRAAEEGTAEILKAECAKGSLPFVLHCFASKAHLAKEGLDLGGYVSFSGLVTFKNAEEIRDVARFVPLDRLLVETDAPYLAPVPMRGKTNEPAFVRHTLDFLADLLQISSEALAQKTTENFFRLFSKAS